jgi:hypothetical protein
MALHMLANQHCTCTPRFGEEGARPQAQALLVTLPLDQYEASQGEGKQQKKKRKVNAIYAVAVQNALGL